MIDIKTKVRHAFHRVGFDLRYFKDSEEGIVRNLIERLRPVAVLDVGANTGQYGRMLRGIGYAGTIISFEPLSSAHEKLTVAARSDRNWIVAPRAALGSSKGSISINVAGNSVSSSVLAMKEQHLVAAPQSRYVATEIVALERLDGLLPSIFPVAGPLILKLDTQGYESEVLKGAEGILPRVVAIQMEISLVPLYQGTSTLVPTVSEMQQRGFHLFQMVQGFRDLTTGQLLQVDGMFVRQLPSAT
ncbi:MAG TPA: FkbM family methyltransferase [Steroidobacteraceae bacterium]|jgi:FkbM family methyltransferase|nr:FkbM family methyltransferase [Steroidobacteraceae bacterium]